jgi:Alternative oxidase.
MRFMVHAVHGIFCNGMFTAYLLWPRICHRIVEYLEEETVHESTRCIEELDKKFPRKCPTLIQDPRKLQSSIGRCPKEGGQ